MGWGNVEKKCKEGRHSNLTEFDFSPTGIPTWSLRGPSLLTDLPPLDRIRWEMQPPLRSSTNFGSALSSGRFSGHCAAQTLLRPWLIWLEVPERR